MDQNFLNDVVELVQASYVDGVPLHWKENSRSVFFIVDYDTFEGLSPLKLQQIFRQQHIIVTDIPQKRTIQFNRRGLETLGAWKKLRTLQGNCSLLFLFLTFHSNEHRSYITSQGWQLLLSAISRVIGGSLAACIFRKWAGH
jgi:hypothetical protein